MAYLLDGPAATMDELSKRLAVGHEGAELQAEVHQLVARVRQLGSQIGEASLERDAAAAQAQRLQREADKCGAESRAASRRLTAARGRLRGGAAADGPRDQRARCSTEEPEAAEASALRAQIEALRREREGMRSEIAACRTELLRGQPGLEELRRRLCSRLGENEGLRHGLGPLPAGSWQEVSVRVQDCCKIPGRLHEDKCSYVVYDA